MIICGDLDDSVAVAARLIIRCRSGGRGLDFANFFYWPISGRRACVNQVQLSVIGAGADPARGQRLLLIAARILVLLHAVTLLLDAGLQGLVPEIWHLTVVV